MARSSNQRLSASARSEITGVSETALELKSGKTVNLADALEDIPKLKNKFLTEEFKNQYQKDLKYLIDSKEPDFSSEDPTHDNWSIKPYIFKFEDKAYEIKFPNLEVSFKIENESFDYSYGSINGTRNDYSFETDEVFPKNVDELFEYSEIRELSPQETKILVPQEAQRESHLAFPKSKDYESVDFPLDYKNAKESFYSYKSTYPNDKAIESAKYPKATREKMKEIESDWEKVKEKYKIT